MINCDEENTYRVIPYEQGLIFPLRLYHIVYQKFTIEKNKSFAEQLIEIVEETLKSCQTEEEIDTLTHSYTSMLLDISNMHGSKREKLWEFTREELYKLLAIEAKLLRMNKQPANIRPVKGVLMMMISNFILKSRNGYNNDYICKYLPIEVAKSSISNHQIWMKKTELLNDEREKKVIPELFEDMSWIHYDWIKDIDFSETRNYYVSCFSKSINNSHMQDGYGECLYGYKNDRIVDLIGPIGLYTLTKKADADADLPDTMKRPYIAQVITFDVLYDIEEAKTELQYLFSVIDMFDLSDNNKKMFLQEILQYWILSVKDSKWKAERERRHARVRNKISGTADRPRLCVFRSNNNLFVQVIDDVAGNTLAQASTLDKEVKVKHSNKEAAKEVGALIAKRALEKNIKEVVFDRGGYIYHGVVKELAEAAREGGLTF